MVELIFSSASTSLGKRHRRRVDTAATFLADVGSEEGGKATSGEGTVEGDSSQGMRVAFVAVVMRPDELERPGLDVEAISDVIDVMLLRDDGALASPASSSELHAYHPCPSLMPMPHCQSARSA